MWDQHPGSSKGLVLALGAWGVGTVRLGWCWECLSSAEATLAGKQKVSLPPLASSCSSCVLVPPIFQTDRKPVGKVVWEMFHVYPSLLLACNWEKIGNSQHIQGSRQQETQSRTQCRKGWFALLAAAAHHAWSPEGWMSPDWDHLPWCGLNGLQPWKSVCWEMSPFNPWGH